MSVEVVTGLKRKATFSIKKDEVQASVKNELKKYAKTAKVQGFRPGKVPANMVEQMYGGKAYEDSLNTHINKKFVDLVVEQKLNIVGNPEFDLTNSEGEEFIFAAVFEVMPEVKLGDLTNLEIEKPTCEFNDENINKTISMLRKQRANYITDSTKLASTDDKVTIDFAGTVDGEPFAGGSAENYPFILGQGVMLPDFESGISGHKIGDNISVTVNFPENYHAENMRNKQAIFNITIKNVETAQLPELNEEFIKSMSNVN